MAVGSSDLALAALDLARVLPRGAVDALRRVDESELRALVAAAARRLQTPSGADDAPPTDHGRDEALTAVVCLLARCARDASEPLMPIRQVVVSCGVDDEALLAKLLPLLAPHVARIRADLRARSFDFAHVVDVSWRLDYVLRSSSQGNVHEPLYFVTLKIQPPLGPMRDLTFSCSVEGLRDLVYRLQGATNAIEKIATNGAPPVQA